MATLATLSNIDRQIGVLERKIKKAEKAKKEAANLLFLLEANSNGFVWGKSAQKNSRGERSGYQYKKCSDILRIAYKEIKTEKGNTFDALFNRLWKLVNSGD